MSAPMTDDDAFWAEQRARAVAERGQQADPSACGTCKDHTEHFERVEHDGCAQRATLLRAPDQPGYELITGMSVEELTALPPRFHVPVFMDTCTPKAWVCAVCWGEGWTSAWPCAAATEHGTEVFTPEHEAQREHDKTGAELVNLRARVAELEAERDGVRSARDAEIIAWLGKKARELRTFRAPRQHVQADAVDVMASKIARGAVRPEVGAGDPS